MADGLPHVAGWGNLLCSVDDTVIETLNIRAFLPQRDVTRGRLRVHGKTGAGKKQPVDKYLH